jgi:hypothetical protein
MQVDDNDGGWPGLFEFATHRRGALPDGFEGLVGQVLRAPDGGMIPSWPQRACRYTDPHVFDAVTRADTVAALRCCASCPVLDDCARWAEEYQERQQRVGHGKGLNCVAGGELWGAARRWLK